MRSNRISFAVIFLLTIFSLSLIPQNSNSCTVFKFTRDSVTVYGQNLDWHLPVPGLMVVNKRGIHKTVLHWKGNWPAGDTREQISWVSLYGSVTSTCYGRDFIDGGMNEAGLIIDEASFEAVYPADDGRPGISCPQWMQFQLDNYATVEEVLAHISDLRPDGEGWHYLIADRNGDCAVIEYLDGEARIYQGDELEFPALTNTSYAQALSHIPMDAAFGGDIDIGSGSDSYGRFVRVAALLRDYDPADDPGISDYAFHILDEVSCENTQRMVVYDATHNRVLWKSIVNNKIRWLDLNEIDFSSGTTTKVIDIDDNIEGNVLANLIDYTIDLNRQVARAVMFPNAFGSATPNELSSRGLTLEEVIEMVAIHPTRPVQ